MTLYKRVGKMKGPRLNTPTGKKNRTNMTENNWNPDEFNCKLEKILDK